MNGYYENLTKNQNYDIMLKRKESDSLLKFIKVSVTTAALILLTSVSAFAQTVGVVNCGALNLRSGPSTADSVIGTLYNGTVVDIMEFTNNGWSKVIYNNLNGFVATQYLSIRSTDGTSRGGSRTGVIEKNGYINTSALNFRVAPSTGADIIGAYCQNNPVYVIEDAGEGWYKTVINGVIGYTAAQYITLGQAPVVNTSKGQQIVEYAKQFLGVPYVYGGNSPSGFDCSGFTKYVMNHFGISIPRVADDQSRAGTYVSRDALMPGDVICFNNGRYNGVNHVGIYVGDGQFIHAPQPGYSIKFDTIQSGYYNDCYYNARRFY